MTPLSPEQLKSISKALASMLRHRPEDYGLTLDPQGWVPCELVVHALRRQHRWRELGVEHLIEVVQRQTKVRYELDASSQHVRALYGHSTSQVQIQKPAACPPPRLYHGTSPEAAQAILADGLRGMSRQFIHMSIDVPTALEVGRRHCARPVLFEVQAHAAHEAGVAFYEGNPQTWLADYIPASFLVIREYSRSSSST